MPCPEKFKQSMIDFNIDEGIRNKINEGYEDLVSSSPKKSRAAYFKRAMDILDENVPNDKIVELMDVNACCKCGAREKNSKHFAKENKEKTMEEKMELITHVPYMGRPELIADNQIFIDAINYWDGKRYRCTCTNFNSIKGYDDVSKSYCLCCAGHFRHHYEIMLQAKLKLIEVVSSPFENNGVESCAFLFELTKE